MPREHARVWLRIWSDDDFCALSKDAQHLYFVLLTSPSLNYAGVADWRPGRIAANARDWTAEEVREAGAELARALYIVIDEQSEEALLRSFIRNDDILKNPNVAVSMAISFGGVASRVLRGVIVHELRRLHVEFPSLKGWGPKVTELLSRKAVDPATYPLGCLIGHPPGDGVPSTPTDPVSAEVDHPLAEGVREEVGSPVDQGIDQGVGYPFDYPLTEGVDQGIDQGIASLPAPAPAPAPATSSGGHPAGERHQASAPLPPTPSQKFHPEHPDRWVDGCDECDALADQLLAGLAATAELAVPADRCPAHVGVENPPNCGPCGDARRARKAWDAERARWEALKGVTARRAAARDRAAEIAACTLCDADGYRGVRVCDHIDRPPRPNWRTLIPAPEAKPETEPETAPEQTPAALAMRAKFGSDRTADKPTAEATP